MLVRIAAALDASAAALIGKTGGAAAPDADELLAAFGRISTEKERQAVISIARIMARLGA
jgi:hypothetical protein